MWGLETLGLSLSGQPTERKHQSCNNEVFYTRSLNPELIPKCSSTVCLGI